MGFWDKLGIWSDQDTFTMLRVVALALALICGVHGSPHVKIQLLFKEKSSSIPVVLMRGFDIPKDVEQVDIHYSINGVLSSSRAAPGVDSWQVELRTHQSRRYAIAAYATFVSKGESSKTDTAYFETNLDETKPKTEVSSPQIPSRQIRAAVVFRDDFNSFNSGQWKHEVSMYGGYNGEFQVYTNRQENVFVRNGQLYLKPTYTVDDSHYDDNSLWHGSMDCWYLWGTCTNQNRDGCKRDGKDGILPPIMSGKVTSQATLKYGTVTVRAKIPQGDWLWPAIWMLPRSSVYGGWPRSGEIDIMESRGNTGDYGTGHVSSTLHWGPDAGQNKYYKTTGSKHTGNWHDNFHTWRLEWRPDHLSTYVDDQQIMWIDPGSNFWNFGGFGGGNIWGGDKMAPFNQDFYMILNNAVGGTSGFFPDNQHGKPWWNNNGQRTSQKDFWNARGSWQPTWHGDDTALIIDYVEFKSM